ncbi:MAG: Coenzyme F420 hydrogenase/dehydrogenase, beta subunit C-terminal domain [Candidatus Bathyarchaeota archaeon]|nr:Coenzyme F420 hydrogenase/dehydrogenase, beta subunit C-terminal domain [Candidatus Bathyarchaeota archaeon]
MEQAQTGKEVTITIDGKQVKAKEGDTLINVARQEGIDIPTLCYHAEVSTFGACRLCSVEVTKHGRTKVVTSCNYPIEEGIEVQTNSEKIRNVRKGILALLMARCPKSVKLKNLGKAYGIEEHGLWESDPDEDCILCGLCVRVCKELVGVSAINFAQRGVEREITAPYHRFSDDCIGCGACALVCPTGSKKIRIHTYATMAPMKGERDDIFGVHTDIFSAKLSNPSEGFIKALLVAGFNAGLFDTAVFAQRTDSGYNAKAVIAENAEAVTSAKEAPFIRVKTMSTLLDAIDQGKRKIAFVGLPCQVRAVRKMAQTMQQEIPDLDITTIGMFCRQSFNPQKLKAEIQKLLNVDIDQAEKVQIRGDKFVVQVAGKEYSCNVDQLNNAIEAGCTYCNDFPAMFADIAFGSEGSADDCSTVLIRTEKGQNLIGKLAFTKGEVAKDQIQPLSESKKNRAKESVAPVLKEIMAQRARKVQ